MSEAIALDDSLPLVGEDRGNRGLWLGLGGIGIAGLLLFAMLEANRQSNVQPQIAPPRDYAIATAPRAELAIPDVYAYGQPVSPGVARPTPSPVSAPPQLSPARLTRIRAPAEPAPPSPPPSAYIAPPPLQPIPADPGRATPAIVYDVAQAAVAVAGVPVTSGTAAQASKAIASGGGDRTYLVSQGTLIFAVLETALDSTQSGQARAMISSDVYNAIGTQILIPKGSRIFGEYKGEIGAGQNRAQIIWTRLARPDGATIALDSPASDQLGRAGVKGRVNTHFGTRLLNALLQSSIDFGVAAASRAATSSNGVIIGFPSSVQSAGSQIVQETPKPTLTVRHGTRIAVFVARDLDFSAVE